MPQNDVFSLCILLVATFPEKKIGVKQKLLNISQLGE